MRDYDLYNLYVMRFGLTFVPKGLDAEAWTVANHLMWCALQADGPLVTHASIQEHLAKLAHYRPALPAYALIA